MGKSTISMTIFAILTKPEGISRHRSTHKHLTYAGMSMGDTPNTIRYNGKHMGGFHFLNEGTPFYGMVLGHIMKHPQKWMDFAQKSTIFLETSGMLPSRSTESTPIFPALRGFFFFTAQAPESPQ